MSEDPVNYVSPEHIRWSRNNTGEAVPGVLTPMTWGFFGPILESAARRSFYELGLIPRSAVPFPDKVEDRLQGVFNGRYSLNTIVVRKIMCAIPGVSGDDVERDVLGYVPEGGVDDPYPWRKPALAFRFPRALTGLGKKSAKLREDSQHFWTSSVGPEGVRGGKDPREVFREATEHFSRSLYLQGFNRMLVQAPTAQLLEFAEKIGHPDAAAGLMGGAAGVDESAVADALWDVAHGRGTLGEFIAEHGFHGPNSGECLQHSWREDGTPLERLLETVKDAERPAERSARAQAEAARKSQELLDSLGRGDRAKAKLLMRLSSSAARNLELTKNSFIIAIDVARGSARAFGDELVKDGTLADREDVFLLTPPELLAARGKDLRELADERRAQREYHLSIEIPLVWTGNPEPLPKDEAPAGEATGPITGHGVSAGIVEGRVCVVMDPANAPEVELGDVLVTPTTDPSWVSLMTVASALVIDIGTASSHGAIVARELGVPCVIGTGDGTRRLRHGDQVRVDGSAGVVEVL